MDENGFRIWLRQHKGQSIESSYSRISNCNRIEVYEGNLDQHFYKDKMTSLIQRLSYTQEDADCNRKPKHNIPINGNQKTGSATLKQAANLYLQFKENGNGSTIHSNQVPTTINPKSNTKQKKDWPKWTTPKDEEMFEIIKLVAKYAKFLNPEIIKKIVEDNEKHRDQWRNVLFRFSINPDIYFWDRSPCAFPGIRRYAGSEEIAFFRKHTEKRMEDIPDTICLDDNDFPKHIWAIIFTLKEFRKQGPENFSLAHILDHKEYKNRYKDDLIVLDDNRKHPLHGLYTSPANTVYLPNSLIRPSDTSTRLRQLLIARAFELYGDICELVPSWLQPKNQDTGWKTTEFEWGVTVGDVSKVDQFLEYREKKLNEIFSSYVN